MDYDRALYRVYERIMEELNASQSPLAMTTTAATSSSAAATTMAGQPRSIHQSRQQNLPRTARLGGGRQELETDGVAATSASDMEGGDASPAGISNNDGDVQLGLTNNDTGNGGARISMTDRTAPARIPPTLTRRRHSSFSTLAMQQRQRQRQHQPLPFLFPIWMARKIDQILMEQNLHQLRHHPTTALDGTHSNITYVAHLWSKIRAWMDVIGNVGGIRHATYTSVTTSVPESMPMSSTPTSVISSMSHRSVSISPGGGDISAGGLNNHNDAIITNHNIELQIEDVEVGEVSSSSLRMSHPSSPPLNSNGEIGNRSSDGLRRRSNSRQGDGQQQNDGSVSPSSTSSRQRLDIISTAQREEQSDVHNNEQHHRRGGGSSSSSSSSSSSDDDISSNDDGDSSSSSDSTSTSSDDSNSARGNRDDDNDTTNDRLGRNNDRNYEQGGCSQLNVYIVMRLSFAIAVFHIFVLISLHCTYVGPHAFQGRVYTQHNVQEISRKQRRDNESNGTKSDMIVNCIANALSTRPIEDRSSYFGEKDNDVPSDGKEGAERRLADETRADLRKQRSFLQGSYDQSAIYQGDMAGEQNAMSSETLVKEGFHPLLGKDEILQVKIIYGSSCVGQCSRVRKVKYPVLLNTESGENSTNEVSPEMHARTLSRLNDSFENQSSFDDLHYVRTLQIEENETVEDTWSSPAYWEKVHYRFSLDGALLHLDEMSAYLHNITFVNVTVTERCLSSGFDDGNLSVLKTIGEFLSQIYGMDSIIINQLMYGIRGEDGAFTSGYVKSMETQEQWGWHSELLVAFENKSTMHVAVRKLGVLSMSMLAFFLVTSVTSLIVRVLTSSGVVLMFPIFTLLRSFGLPGADERIISLSYPWIGAARAAISTERSHPQATALLLIVGAGHFVWAQVTKVILYYVMYEACQAVYFLCCSDSHFTDRPLYLSAWSVVLYAKSIPEALPVWIYGFAMIWEYFSMVFIRSALSVHFFPRVILMYFFCYHVYFYSVPYGFFDIGLVPLFFFGVHAMLFTILGLEVPNSARGVLSVSCPREVYNRLSWQEPSAAIPQEWTIFLPLNSRLIPLHDRSRDRVTVPMADTG
ncbi:hypothetical protein ACHAWU_003424 [Discostella pseudostelligera]|uniref:Transmembrane protein n=1 Tax=Discostella pseudostelligera TaxID=259834 RepID=A0ABD3MRW5_9STRA